MTPNPEWLKWTAPVLILVQVALWASGASEARQVALLIVIVETLVAGLVVGRAVVLLRTARWQRRTGDTWVDLAAISFMGLLPGPVAGFAASEVRVLGTLIQWIVTEVRRRPTGYPYNGSQNLTGWVMLFALSAPAEMLLLHMLIPWTLLKYLFWPSNSTGWSGSPRSVSRSASSAITSPRRKSGSDRAC